MAELIDSHDIVKAYAADEKERGPKEAARRSSSKGLPAQHHKNNIRWDGSAKLAIFYKFLSGSFSAVSKPSFSRKYAFDSIFL